jgi:hypothetical protein
MPWPIALRWRWARLKDNSLVTGPTSAKTNEACSIDEQASCYDQGRGVCGFYITTFGESYAWDAA